MNKDGLHAVVYGTFQEGGYLDKVWPCDGEIIVKMEFR